MADAADLKSASERSEGSNPSVPITWRNTMQKLLEVAPDLHPAMAVRCIHCDMTLRAYNAYSDGELIFDKECAEMVEDE